MALIEKIWNDWVVHAPSLHLDPVEAAQMSKSSSLWSDNLFADVPPSAYQNAQLLRNQVCRGCTLYSGSEGDFERCNLKEIIVYQHLCSGIYLNSDGSIPFRAKWWLQAAAPKGTFSLPDPRAVCARSRPDLEAEVTITNFHQSFSVLYSEVLLYKRAIRHLAS